MLVFCNISIFDQIKSLFDQIYVFYRIFNNYQQLIL